MASNEDSNFRRVPIADIHPDPGNVRSHDRRNIEAIAASLTRFGQQKPIVVDPTGVVIAGNGTLEAARSLGWETIMVIDSDLSGAERTAYAIADNRTAELAAWSDDLGEVLKGLDGDIELADIGFTQDELDALIGDQVKITSLDLRPTPTMTWVLIGIPTVRYAEVSEHVEAIAGVDGAIVEMTANEEQEG